MARLVLYLFAVVLLFSQVDSVIRIYTNSHGGDPTGRYLVVMKGHQQVTNDTMHPVRSLVRISQMIAQRYGVSVLRQFTIGNWRALLINVDNTNISVMTGHEDDDIDYIETEIRIKAFAHVRTSQQENDVLKPPKRAAINSAADTPTEEVTPVRDSHTTAEPVVCYQQTPGASIWALPRISHHSIPSYSSGSYMFTSIDRGTSVDAYIVDTGIRTTHIEFGGRADRGYVARGLNESPDDNNGHGTHVASLVAGDTVGVAKEAEVISVKVLNADGYGDVSWIVDGLQWISDRVQKQRSAGYQPKAIINMSLGAAGVSYTLEDAIQALVDDVKIPVVAAAGNDNSDACSVSPARMASVITVGATTDNDRMASFSNYGSCVDMLAPGERILGAYGTGDDMYAVISGTSQATPLVTGVLSRYMSSIDGPPPSPSFLKAYVTDTASANYITFTSDIENTTPNKLLYRACESMGSDLPNYRPTFPVNSNVSGSSNISIMYIVPVLNFIILLLSFIGVMFDGFSCLC